eukprot:TRINITY_DN1787_c4_g1_i1.p1 TRINITY_DN1787_c4_g1~~TRINITY_DN1787_c4_g1_i1.p1  ORF type:complete len:300 (+),score=75.24 TRINITY_DN1787_c4_g1_i1:118-1017(+)
MPPGAMPMIRHTSVSLLALLGLLARATSIGHSWSQAGVPPYSGQWPRPNRGDADGQQAQQEQQQPPPQQQQPDDYATAQAAAPPDGYQDASQQQQYDEYGYLYDSNSQQQQQQQPYQPQRSHTPWTEPPQQQQQPYPYDAYTGQYPDQYGASQGYTEGPGLGSRLKSFVSKVKDKVQDAVASNPTAYPGWQGEPSQYGNSGYGNSEYAHGPGFAQQYEQPPNDQYGQPAAPWGGAEPAPQAPPPYQGAAPHEPQTTADVPPSYSYWQGQDSRAGAYDAGAAGYQVPPPPPPPQQRSSSR